MRLHHIGIDDDDCQNHDSDDWFLYPTSDEGKVLSSNDSSQRVSLTD